MVRLQHGTHIITKAPGVTMKAIVAIFLIFCYSNVSAETIVNKIDRSAQEAVDEVKEAGKIVIKKLKKNTNSKTDDEVILDSKKKDQRK